MNIVFACLKVIQSLCISCCYSNNVNNQTLINKQGGIILLLDILKKNNDSNILKSHVYYTLSMICLNNQKNCETLFAVLSPIFILNECRKMLITSKNDIDEISSLNRTHKNLEEQVNELDIQITAGLALCGFCYQNNEFVKKMSEKFENINWDFFKCLFIKHNKLLKNALFFNDVKRHFMIQQFKFLLSFQICILYNYINKSEEDPRACGVKLITDILMHSPNSYLRSIACDYIGRLVSFSSTFFDPFICIDTIELLAMSTYNSEQNKKICGETEIVNSAITLGFI
jgi:hypothetical protein